jgi:uncharacterized membrane protein YsdA (DUF1294 family)
VIKIRQIFYYYLIIINIVSLITMYYDKRKAALKGWRVPEARLFMLAFIFGSPGILAGMYLFHHKTKHLKFVIGIPAVMALQIYIIFKYIVMI